MIKQFGRLLAFFGLIFGCLGWMGHQAAIAAPFNAAILPSSSVLAVEESRINRADNKLSEIGYKVDLNNSAVRNFRQFKGLYPNLAAKIIKNAPYAKVEDVLEIPGLTEAQKDLLKANLNNFTVTNKESTLNEGDNRLNNGLYD
jgi:photosystem II PsbU protein